MFKFDISMTPPASVLAGEFGLLASQLEDAEELVRDLVHQIVRPAIRANFASQGSRVGGWESHSPFTKSPTGRLLDRGRGAVGLKYVAQQKNLWTFINRLGQAEGFISQADAWSRIPYGVAHQFGYLNARTGGRVAARPFWVLADEDIQRIEEKTAEWVDRQIGSSIGSGA